jgi:hypothetical protein
MSRSDDVAVGVISADIGLTLERKLPVERLQKPIGLPLPNSVHSSYAALAPSRAIRNAHTA